MSESETLAEALEIVDELKAELEHSKHHVIALTHQRDELLDGIQGSDLGKVVEYYRVRYEAQRMSARNLREALRHEESWSKRFEQDAKDLRKKLAVANSTLREMGELLLS